MIGVPRFPYGKEARGTIDRFSALSYIFNHLQDNTKAIQDDLGFVSKSIANDVQARRVGGHSRTCHAGATSGVGRTGAKRSLLICRLLKYGRIRRHEKIIAACFEFFTAFITR